MLSESIQSPEVLLNNALFHQIFFDEKFRDRLISTVVDEAHMVYIWGLVASGKAKKIISHLKHQDRAIFRPLYGKLGSKLVLTNGVPARIYQFREPTHSARNSHNSYTYAGVVDILQ